MKGAPHVVSYFQIPIPHASFASLRTTATHVRCTRFYGCSFSHVAFPGPSPIAVFLYFLLAKFQCCAFLAALSLCGVADVLCIMQKKLFNVHAYSTERDLELERAGYGGIWDLQYPTRSWSWAALPGPRGRCQRKRGLCYEACRMPNGVVALSACCRLFEVCNLLSLMGGGGSMATVCCVWSGRPGPRVDGPCAVWRDRGRTHLLGLGGRTRSLCQRLVHGGWGASLSRGPRGWESRAGALYRWQPTINIKLVVER